MRIDTGTRSRQQRERPPTTSLVDEMHIYGRNDEKEAIVQMLLRDQGGNNSISVVPILGMGGIGKTTLAQLVYNDSAIKNYFEFKIWVCVSENFDVIGLTRTILRNVDPKIHDLKDLDLNSLQEKLKEKLFQKKFLLILDDVWEEDYDKWELLRRPLVTAAPVSKIVVTTRKNNVAPITADVSLFYVKELPDDDCLLLLACHALAAQSFDARLDLKDIGQELVRKCNGLPLAAKVLGGLLRNKRNRVEWERVLRNKLWNSPETSNSVHPSLKLSYDDLPSHLKRCFVYCAIFPKDYEFYRDELVLLWMAEGFLHHPRGGRTMEDLGIEYFEELVSRSFFQSLSSDQSTNFSKPRSFFGSTSSIRSAKFVMHDLISDLAQTIAEDICYNYENKTEVDMSSSKYQNVRHASFSFDEESQEYEVYSRMKRLRTIVFFSIGELMNEEVDYEDEFDEMPDEFFTKSKCMRVISLPYFPITKLSNSIGDLIHLRYINLSHTDIQQLPESVSTLFNLQTLLLCSCCELVKLPDRIRNLVNLRHLDISETDELQKLPSGIGMLSNLQTLSKFIVKEDEGTTIAELQNLNSLRGSLSIQGLQNVPDAKLANLKGKQGLEELVLEWDVHERNDMLVLESLEPHQNLKRLTISCYDGAEFPSWMTNIHLFSYMVSLNLRYCGETKVIPPLGHLCSLKELCINGLKAVRTIGVEFYGNVVVPFPSLERLEISYMSKWIEWSHGNMGGEVFPNLRKLELSYCRKLIGSFPSEFHRLRHLSELSIKGCGSFVSFPLMGLPCSLKRIHVRDCDAVQCFPIFYTDNSEQSLLEVLHIEGCSALKYFERNFKLPTSLRKLTILNCGNLLSLPDGLMVQDDNTNGFQPQSHLEHLKIMKCQGLTSLPNGKFPAALKTLEFGGCLQLESAISEKNTALERIDIRDNDIMKAFPCSIDSLQRLYIKNCQNLSFQHIQIQSRFPSLRELFIRNCPNVAPLIEDGGLPRNLTKLKIRDCENLRQPIADWGLGMLSSLGKLEVGGRCPTTADVISFPDDNCCWLPTSLKKLHIKDFINLESVSMGLQRLTSLEELSISDCPKLRSLPKEALPFSLKEMGIHGCPLLKKKNYFGD